MTKNIFIVDDEADILMSIKGLLESKGYNVTALGGGEQCLEKLKEEKPDLILLDFFMPGMSGRETIEKIRQKKEYDNVKIIFMTVAEFRDIGKEKIKELKVSDYITKPIDIKALLASVKKHTK